MIHVDAFVKYLHDSGVTVFTGVPHYGEPLSQRLKSFCAYLTDTCGENHVIAANEGSAVGWGPAEAQSGSGRGTKSRH